MDALGSSAISQLVNCKLSNGDGCCKVGRLNRHDVDCKAEALASNDAPDYLKELLRRTQATIRAAASLPTHIEYGIATSVPDNAKKAASATGRIAHTLHQMLHYVCPAELEKGPLSSPTPAMLVGNYEKFADCIDAMLMKVDRALRICEEQSPSTSVSEALALRPREAIGVATACREQGAKNAGEPPGELLAHGTSSGHAGLYSLKTLWQQAFQQSDVNVGRFVPSIKYKPCGVYKLPPEVYEAQQQVEAAKSSSVLKSTSRAAVERQPPLPHLYEEEIRALDWENPTTPEGCLRLFESVPAVEYPAVGDTPLVWVRTKEALHEMIEELKNHSHVAIDVEHHSLHSFKGVTCLIQLSTRDKDYLVDPLNLVQDLWQLNYVTANPGILKVLHGADHDVLWLQRDFSIYFVNLFDTCQAARVLSVPGGASLANLLTYYCRISADKKYQLADWRLRPLPAAMVAYARSDTHYLLYIHDRLRQDLLRSASGEPEKGKERIRTVLERSRTISLKCHQDPDEIPPEQDAKTLWERSPCPLGPTGFSLLAALVAWRTETARTLDESPHSIISNATLVRMAVKAPRTWAELQHVTHPIPNAVQRYAPELLSVITKSVQSAPNSDAQDAKIYETVTSGGHEVPPPSGVSKYAKVSKEATFTAASLIVRSPINAVTKVVGPPSSVVGDVSDALGILHEGQRVGDKFPNLVTVFPEEPLSSVGSPTVAIKTANVPNVVVSVSSSVRHASHAVKSEQSFASRRRKVDLKIMIADGFQMLYGSSSPWRATAKRSGSSTKRRLNTAVVAKAIGHRVTVEFERCSVHRPLCHSASVKGGTSKRVITVPDTRNAFSMKSQQDPNNSSVSVVGQRDTSETRVEESRIPAVASENIEVLQKMVSGDKKRKHKKNKKLVCLNVRDLNSLDLLVPEDRQPSSQGTSPGTKDAEPRLADVVHSSKAPAKSIVAPQLLEPANERAWLLKKKRDRTKPKDDAQNSAAPPTGPERSAKKRNVLGLRASGKQQDDKFLPASVVMSVATSPQEASSRLPSLPAMPKLFGNSAAASTKNKSTLSSRKRKKFGL